MQAVKSKNTAPELFVRRFLHVRGYRYRLHKRELPGCPDLVFSGRKKVIFVNGCFWHGHGCAHGGRVPKSNTQYWTAKVARNRARDAGSRKQLRAQGWNVLVLWECRIRDEARLTECLDEFLGDP